MSSSTPYFPTTNSTSFTTSVPVVATPSLMAPTSLQTNATGTNNSSTTGDVGVGIGLGITAMLIALGIVLFTIFYIKRKKQTKKNAEESPMTPSSAQTTRQSPSSPYVSLTSTFLLVGSGSETTKVSPVSSATGTRKFTRIPLNDIVLEQTIGEGHYGNVYLAKWNSALVAVKFCKGKGQEDIFLREINVM